MLVGFYIGSRLRQAVITICITICNVIRTVYRACNDGRAKNSYLFKRPTLKALRLCRNKCQ